MSDALLALWVALIGADRIDLAGGHGPFILTPFLALTPIVALSEIARHMRRARPIVVSRRALAYATVATALVCLALTSVFFSQEMPVSAARACLLLADVAGTFVVAVLVADRPDLLRIFARGAMACLILFAVFDVVEALWWIGRAPEFVRVGPASLHFGNLANAGPLPRLAGPVGDGNRGGFVLLFYGVVIAAGEPHRLLRRAAIGFIIVLLVLTFSRSTTLAVTATLIMIVLTRRARLTPRPFMLITSAVALAAAFFLWKPEMFQRAADAVAPIGERVSVHQGSAESHLELIQRGLDQATRSVPRAAIGLGYGNSYLVLQDMFPGNRYGNFHSLYVTMFAESGVLALLLMLVLTLTPLAAGGPWRALIAGAIAFNIFYQTTTEPVFWFLLATAWLTIPSRGRRARATAFLSDETSR